MCFMPSRPKTTSYWGLYSVETKASDVYILLELFAVHQTISIYPSTFFDVWVAALISLLSGCIGMRRISVTNCRDTTFSSVSSSKDRPAALQISAFPSVAAWTSMVADRCRRRRCLCSSRWLADSSDFSTREQDLKVDWTFLFNRNMFSERHIVRSAHGQELRILVLWQMLWKTKSGRAQLEWGTLLKKDP